MGWATEMARLPLVRPATTLSTRASPPVEVWLTPALLNSLFRSLSYSPILREEKTACLWSPGASPLYRAVMPSSLGGRMESLFVNNNNRTRLSQARGYCSSQQLN